MTEGGILVAAHCFCPQSCPIVATKGAPAAESLAFCAHAAWGFSMHVRHPVQLAFTAVVCVALAGAAMAQATKAPPQSPPNWNQTVTKELHRPAGRDAEGLLRGGAGEGQRDAIAADRCPSAHLGLGRLHAARGDTATAQEHLDCAAALYREMEMTAWLVEVEAARVPFGV